MVEIAKIVGEDSTGKNKMRVRTLVHSSRCQMDPPPEPIAEEKPKSKAGALGAQRGEVV